MSDKCINSHKRRAGSLDFVDKSLKSLKAGVYAELKRDRLPVSFLYFFL